MSKYVKNFLLRGMMFSGLGPIVLGIVYVVLQHTIDEFSLNGTEVLIAIISTYLIAFVQAGASIFNQVEEWSVLKSITVHLSTLYVLYLLVYVINSWIPFDWKVVGIFSLIFIVSYFIIWIIVCTSIRITSNKLNKKISEV